MSLRDDIQSDDTERLHAQVEILKRERNEARRHAAVTQSENEALQKVAEFSTRRLNPPKWLRPRKKAQDRRAIICSILSDTHFDEVVNPAELGGYNAFDRPIGEQRLERFFHNSIMLSRQYLAGVEYDGAVLFLGGDILSGNIHDLQETNDATLFDGALHWSDRIAAGIKMWADEFGRVFLPCTVGNHPRLTMRERTKRRVRDNADWLISQQLARHFADDERVTFDIPDSIHVPVQVYDTNFLLYHGQTGGGGGIGGIWPPIMRLRSKLATRYDFDVLVLGHWHQLIHAPEQGLIVNGSLKGYDEFAQTMAFSPERAQQALFLVTPEHGVSFAAPVFVSDPVAEGWG